MATYYKRITQAEIHRFICSTLLATDRTNDDHAVQLADFLLAADKRGQHANGLQCLRMHCDALRTGVTDGVARPQIRRQNETIAWVDGRNAIGVIVGNWCMDIAMQKARRIGIGLVCCRGTNQYGMAGWYAERAQRNGMLGITIGNNCDVLSTIAIDSTTIAMAAAGESKVAITDMIYALVTICEICCALLPEISIGGRAAEAANLGQMFIAVDSGFFANGFETRLEIFKGMLHDLKAVKC